MTDSPYQSEDHLQELLAEHPELMPGELVNADDPRRWLLLTREAGIALAGDSGGSRWSMDHLFVDQDGTPTLVEVKRSSDTRSRREVVAQMLDYASNLWAWPPGKAQECLAARCRRDGSDPDAELAGLSSESDADTFWSQVDANIAAGHLRLVFVADRIGPELRQIIEFLNSQFAKAEVLAVEIRQWQGEGVDTLVSEVIGRTAASEKLKPTPRRWERDEFLSAMRERSTPADAQSTSALIAWCEDHGGWVTFGKGKTYAACYLNWRREDPIWPLIPTLPNSIAVPFDTLSTRTPFKENPTLLDDFREQLMSVEGLVLTPAKARPSFPMSVLADSTSRKQIEDALRFFIEQISGMGE